MITGPSIRSCVGVALGILESDDLDEVTTASDIRGKHPGDKDYQRMYDIQDKAGGNEAKALDLAKKMAAAIGRGAGGSSREKAHRRAKAAKDVFPGRLGQQMAQMFMDAADVKFLPRSTESKETTVSKRSIDGPNMRREMNEVNAILGRATTENIDNISREQAQEEGEEFLRIIGLTEGRQSLTEGAMQNKIEDEWKKLGAKYGLDCDFDKSYSNTGQVSFRNGFDTLVCAHFNFQDRYMGIEAAVGSKPPQKDGRVNNPTMYVLSYLEYHNAGELKEMMSWFDQALKRVAPKKKAAPKAKAAAGGQTMTAHEAMKQLVHLDPNTQVSLTILGG